MRCINCTRDVPDGRFCTLCGRHQIHGASRFAHYAAHPGEHVFSPGIITSLFPHLGQQKLHEFRWALLAGVGCLFLLDLAGLIAAALLCAAFLVPVLYLMYFYEAQVYRDEPATVLGFTMAGGIVLGIVVSVIVKATTGTLAFQTLFGQHTNALLIFGLLVPVGEEVLKPLPALLWRGRAFPERVDGLVFGVATGLGFSLADTLVRFSTLLTTLPAQVAPANWIYPLFSLAVLLPLLQGSTTGIIVCALWRLRRGTPQPRTVLVIVAAVAAHVGFVLVSELLAERGLAQLLLLGWQAALVAGLLIVVRYLLHETLNEEARDMGFSAVTCANCHQRLMAARYCPQCGKAFAATPSRTRQRGAGAATAPVVEV